MNTTNNRLVKASFLGASLIGILALAACSTAPPTPAGKSDLRDSSADALNQAQQNDPSLRDIIQASSGYAVFPSVGKGAIGIGGAYGKGDVYQNGAVVGYCDMTQGSIGVQLGGQDYVEILVFQNPEAVQRFENGNFTFDAQATAVAVKSGAGANAKFENGVAVFTMAEAGLMYEAAVGGQNFAYQAR
ncbi:MAG: YSC84-related protein [Tepidisphaeraceae bacterium]|jgi:lipid-binding SYLF domain-containing protein